VTVARLDIVAGTVQVKANVWLKASRNDPEVNSHRFRDFGVTMTGGVYDPIAYGGRIWTFSHTYIEEYAGAPHVEWLVYKGKEPA